MKFKAKSDQLLYEFVLHRVEKYSWSPNSLRFYTEYANGTILFTDKEGWVWCDLCACSTYIDPEEFERYFELCENQ